MYYEDSNIYFFEKEEGGGARTGICRYPYLKHTIELYPGYWEENLWKINELVFEKNRNQQGSGKTQAIRKFYKNDFWKFIGCILLVVKY